jgi:hypothetical protein
MTTCLPYRLGSRKSDVTRKNDPDDGEQRREPDRDHCECPRQPGRERRVCDDDHEHREREQEVGEHVLAGDQILGPEHRQAGDGDENGRGDRDDERHRPVHSTA